MNIKIEDSSNGIIAFTINEYTMNTFSLNLNSGELISLLNIPESETLK